MTNDERALQSGLMSRAFGLRHSFVIGHWTFVILSAAIRVIRGLI